MINIEQLVENLEAMAYSFLFKYKDIFFAAFVAIFVGRRIIRIGYGGRYSTRSLIFSPLFYFGFTGATYVGLSTIDLLICSIAFALGLGLSSVMKGQLKFFERKGELHYKRSPLVGLAWTIAFVIRVYLLIYYDITAGFILSVILSYLSGLIVGEVFQIAIQKKLFDVQQMERAKMVSHPDESSGTQK